MILSRQPGKVTHTKTNICHQIKEIVTQKKLVNYESIDTYCNISACSQKRFCEQSPILKYVLLICLT